VLVPAQLHALRLRRDWTQKQFAQASGMKQPRVSAMEQPGAVNFNLETLIRSAATHGLGLIVKFVPFSEMLRWENNFDQDSFNPTHIDKDKAFLSPDAQTTSTWDQLSTFQLMPVETVNIGEWSGGGILSGLHGYDISSEGNGNQSEFSLVASTSEIVQIDQR